MSFFYGPPFYSARYSRSYRAEDNLRKFMRLRNEDSKFSARNSTPRCDHELEDQQACYIEYRKAKIRQLRKQSDCDVCNALSDALHSCGSGYHQYCHNYLSHLNTAHLHPGASSLQCNSCWQSCCFADCDNFMDHLHSAHSSCSCSCILGLASSSCCGRDTHWSDVEMITARNKDRLRSLEQLAYQGLAAASTIPRRRRQVSGDLPLLYTDSILRGGTTYRNTDNSSNRYNYTTTKRTKTPTDNTWLLP